MVALHAAFFRYQGKIGGGGRICPLHARAYTLTGGVQILPPPIFPRSLKHDGTKHHRF